MAEGQRVTCHTCRDRFWRPKGSKRVHCEVCAPPRVKSVPDGPAVAAEGDPAASRLAGSLERRAVAELEAAGRLDTLPGEALLYVSRQLDAGGHSGSQTAALMQRLLEIRVTALAGAKPVTDALDDLQKRRVARAAGA